jgi:4-hydroxybenzoate polyprenyltransferase
VQVPEEIHQMSARQLRTRKQARILAIVSVLLLLIGALLALMSNPVWVAFALFGVFGFIFVGLARTKDDPKNQKYRNGESPLRKR